MALGHSVILQEKLFTKVRLVRLTFNHKHRQVVERGLSQLHLHQNLFRLLLLEQGEAVVLEHHLLLLLLPKVEQEAVVVRVTDKHF
jgi:hypothetical protein